MNRINAVKAGIDNQSYIQVVWKQGLILSVLFERRGYSLRICEITKQHKIEYQSAVKVELFIQFVFQKSMGNKSKRYD